MRLRLTAVLAAILLAAGCSKPPEPVKPVTPVKSSSEAKPPVRGKFAPMYAAANAVGEGLTDSSRIADPDFRKNLDAFKLAIQESMPLSKSESEDDLLTLFIAAHMRAEEAALAVGNRAPGADGAIASAKRAVAKATAAELPQ